MEFTKLDPAPFVDEYGYFGEMGIKLEPTRLSYMLENGWDSFIGDLSAAISTYFYYSYIGTHPLPKWLKMTQAALDRSVQNHYPEISFMYSEGEKLRILDGGETGHKNKTVGSQFPQSAIQETEAYATDSTDDVGREVKTLGALDALNSLNNPEAPYQGVIQYILKDISHCFSILNF